MNNPNKIKTSAVYIQAAERRIEALKLRRSGLTYAAIGEKMRVCPQTAHQYVKKAYELLLKEQSELAAEVRELTRERLDALLAAHWDKAVSGEDKPAAELVLKITDRLAKIYGADSLPRPDQGDSTGALSEEELKQQARMQGLDISDLEAKEDVSEQDREGLSSL